MKTYLSFFAMSLATFAQDSPAKRQETTNTEANGTSTHMLWQPKPEHGVFDLKQTDKTGKVTQWYQYYVDSEGKVIIGITRFVGDGNRTYESIQFITHYTYNADGNVLEENEFFGDGTLRHRIVYRYDAAGKWLQGDLYDATGKLRGQKRTPPEAHLYGEKHKK